ncbi:MAG TPA: DUF86 domain-containing protein, partial [Candidatus Thermoplasmatota archaeon]|nr:DUF86 domain-containing protein [Candidatus Thermoplasmatota archaeon]
KRKRILVKLDEMKQYVEDLEMMIPRSLDEYEEDLVIKRACERTVEAAIETVLKVSAMIVSSEKMGLPQNEETIFDLLKKQQVVSSTLSSKLKKMKGFRNLLIHRYEHIKDDLVYEFINNQIDDFYEFEKTIKSYLSSNE